MNFLFGALLLILLLFPGIAFRIGYLSLPLSSKSFKSSFLEELLFSLVPAFIFQIAGYAIVQGIRGLVNEKAIYLLLINSDKVAFHALGLSSVLRFALYLIILVLAALGSGFIFRRISIHKGWHLNYTFLRIYNEWDIYFRAIILDRNGQPGSRRVSEVLVNVLVENKNDSYIYTGILADYIVDRDEKLERIYLKAVRRRKFSNDREPASAGLADNSSKLDVVDYSDGADFEEAENAVTESLDSRYYYMPGQYFMIPAKEIKNINVIYYSVE